MPDRKKTPSVLDDLLGGAPAPSPEPEGQTSGSPDVKKARGTEAQRARRPAVQKSVSTEVQTSVSTEGQQAKVKTTFLYSAESMARLEAFWYELRLSSGRKDVSRSQIIEQALELALADKSRLSQALLKQKERP